MYISIIGIVAVVIGLMCGFVWALTRNSNKNATEEEPEYASETEAEDMVVKTMDNLPDLLDDMKSAKEAGDSEWITKYLENEENIAYLKKELERYGDAIFDTEDVVKYLQWYYAEKV